MNIVFIDEARILRVQFSGLWTIKDITAKSKQVQAECLARKKDFLLFDFMDVENEKIGLLDRWKLGLSILPILGKISKVAGVAPARLMDPERFAEQVARNRGLNLRSFTNLDDARRWLLAGLPSAEAHPV
jgi:hypothetical protein